MYQLTTATTKLSKLRKRIRGVAGGTSAGKTISILQLLIDDAQTDTSPTLTSIVSESFPHLRRGAMRDFLNIMQEHGYFKDDRWEKTNFTYTFESGSKIEFFSADQPGKVRGPRRDRLFVNEVNNIPEETWTQLLIRTKDYAWADWNPVSSFWWYEEDLPSRPDVDFITLTYKDNEGLSADIVREIESRRNNKNWWMVYGLGQLGEIEGRIYTGWRLDLDHIPHEARLERRGLDFGYSNDPAALVDLYYYNGSYILDERLYRKGMHNKPIADFINNLENPATLIMADSAEPKSIDELRMYGINVLPTEKGPGSVNRGIDYVQDQKISVTKRSTNLIKEYRNYMWKTDKDGNQLRVPETGMDHLMDASRYALESMRPKLEDEDEEVSTGNILSLYGR
jgi:phage terminase large subunit